MTIWRGLLIAVPGTALVLGACSTERSYVGVEDAGAPPGDFAPPPSADGGDATALEAPDVPLCMSTECPAPYATCAKTASFLCATNLRNDKENCGACGVSCTALARGLNMGARCVEGACVFECIVAGDPFYDCNGIIDDGCETNVGKDDENCGGCGIKCAPGVRCISGQCGCPSGLVDCGGDCVDTRFDDMNCGACHNECPPFPDDGCDPIPAESFYGCGDRACGALKCHYGFGDCNRDLGLGCASDGCETNLRTNPEHCGACGVKCSPGQVCRDQGNGPECSDACGALGLGECPYPLAGRDATACIDFRNDPKNCGACGIVCPAGVNQVATCEKGVCGRVCEPGFADCNGDPIDGCEVDLGSHPANCGACGNACDFAEGQPCVNGQCLVAPCDGGVVTK